MLVQQAVPDSVNPESNHAELSISSPSEEVTVDDLDVTIPYELEDHAPTPSSSVVPRRSGRNRKGPDWERSGDYEVYGREKKGERKVKK